jgi:hypothetical protein
MRLGDHLSDVGRYVTSAERCFRAVGVAGRAAGDDADDEEWSEIAP